MPIAEKQTVGVIIVTHRAKHHLPRCLPPILAAKVRPRVLVVNSSSNDGTVEEAQRLGAETLVIPREEFNHGSTRERARQHLGTTIVVMMTPDAYLREPADLDRLVAPMLEGRASLSYGKQIPHEGADFFEAYLRQFNYPEKSHVRSMDDVPQYGVYSFFSSNAFAGYLNSALDEIGGFRSTLTSEDAIAAAMLLRAGHSIAYVAEAVVHHSHRYTLAEEFRRYFDTGYGRRQYRDVFSFAGRHGRLGRAYVGKMFSELAKSKPALLPYAVANVGAKWLGYRIGRVSAAVPDGVKMKLSAQDYYWTSADYKALKNAGQQAAGAAGPASPAAPAQKASAAQPS